MDIKRIRDFFRRRGQRHQADKGQDILQPQYAPSLSKALEELAESIQEKNQEINDWRDTSRMLLSSVQKLCDLCDDLIGVIDESGDISDNSRQLMKVLPAKVESVRNYAADIAAKAGIPGLAESPIKEDPYSLDALRRIMDQGPGGP